MITVFTPVYNRAYIINNLYESLKRQTSYNFEWIVIDDGSTDNVFELLNTIKNNEKNFPVYVERVQNGGKHRAINRGVELAKGDAFFIVDSDDFLADNAIELISQWWETIENKEEIAAVSGLKAYFDNVVVGSDVGFAGYIDASNLERSLYGLDGDKAEVYRTEILKKYPFPEFEGENFLTEAVVWDAIAYDGFKIRWFNQIIYYCEYLPDGLTKAGQSLFFNNPNGWGRYIGNCFKFGREKEEKFETIIRYYIECVQNKLTNEQIINALQLPKEKLLPIIEKKDKVDNKISKNAMGYNNAVYGLGNFGIRLINYYKKLNIDIKYYADEKITDFGNNIVYKLNTIPDDVDNICVTMKNVPENLLSDLTSRYPNAYIWTFMSVYE